MTLEHRAASVEIRGGSKAGTYTEMHIRVCPYNTPADIGGLFIETMLPGVFAKSIRESARGIPLLNYHNQNSLPLGAAVDWQDEADGLYATFRLDSRAEVQDIARVADEIILPGASVGFQPIRSGWDWDAEPPAVERVEASLREVSLVPAGAFDDAQVLMVRTAGAPAGPPTPRLDTARAMWLQLRGR